MHLSEIFQSIVFKSSFKSILSHQMKFARGLCVSSPRRDIKKQTPHIAEGEADCPPLIPGSLRCYNMKYCPYAQRTLLVLVHKKVNFDIVNVNLKKKPSWFLERSANGLVPTLERSNAETICESLITMEYLEEEYPDPAILPRDPWLKAKDKIMAEMFSLKVARRVMKMFYVNPVGIPKDDLVEKLDDEMDNLERELCNRDTEFFFGDSPGYLDFVMWPWFERMPVSESLFQYTMINQRHNKLKAWKRSMEGVEAVQALMVPSDEQVTFIASFTRHQPDYNFSFQKRG